MNSNIVYYSLLCKNCNGREPNSMSIINHSESFINFSRNELLRECNSFFSQRKCSNCAEKGNYAVWALWCGEQPRQIHIQLQRKNGKMAVDIWDEKHRHLNHTLEQLPFSDTLCQLLSRAVQKLELELDAIVSNTQDAIDASYNNGIGGDVFYSIYEEAIDFDNNHSNLGCLVYTENNFDFSDIENLLLWIEKNHLE